MTGLTMLRLLVVLTGAVLGGLAGNKIQLEEVQERMQQEIQMESIDNFFFKKFCCKRE